MNLAWVIVAFADRLLHRFHGRDTHPGKLHRTELPLIADLVDREFVPRPMTAGVKEDVDSTHFLDDLLFILLNLRELLRGAVIYAGRVVEVRNGIFL